MSKELPRYSQVKPPTVEETNEDLAKQYKKFQSAPKFDLNSEEVYCICRKPDHGGELMIGCDGCDEWFHFKCMKINVLYKNLIAKFYCKFCSWQGVGYTHWKRKCRVDNCWNPIAANSKYCSQECGLKFFQHLTTLKNNHDIKALINGGFDVEGFKTLGNKFPELAEVQDIENNIDKFPEELKLDLTKSINKLREINDIIDLYNSRIQLLGHYKDKMKVINERITTQKKSKKKLELCLYNKQLRQVTPELIDALNVDDVCKFVMASDDDDYFGDICIHEKRKCPRHNAWPNLIHDEFLNTIHKQQMILSKLQQEEKLVLRDYSIQVYEL